MARVATIRNRCIAIMTENKDKKMDDVVAILEAEFGWTNGNARNAYRWNVRQGNAPGVIETARRTTAKPAETTPATPVIVDAAALTADLKPADKPAEEKADEAELDWNDDAAVAAAIEKLENSKPDQPVA